jgi:uncharacterized protein YcnI
MEILKARGRRLWSRAKVVLATVVLLAPAIAAAHVTVWPKTSAAGAHERYAIRVPNEKNLDTVRVEVRFPVGVRVTSFEQKPEWLTEPVRDAKGSFIGVRWSGHLPPQQFAEFGLIAMNPTAQTSLVWTAVQTFSDGSSVEWSGGEGTKTPAPRVTIR